MTPGRLDRVLAALGGILTSRGWALLAVCLLSLLVAVLVGIDELYGLCAGGLAALAGAVVWTRVTASDVDGSHHLHPQRVAAGQRAAVDLEVRNRSNTTPTQVFSLVETAEPARRCRELRVAPLQPNERVVQRYQLAPAERGSHCVGPLAAVTTDPFGLARRQRLLAPAERLVVHPLPLHLNVPVVAGGTGRGGGNRALEAGSDNDEFASLREYVPGDDLRKVHWSSSARTDTLLVREEEQDHRGRVVVVLDLRAVAWTPPGLEVALGVTAGFAEEAHARQLPFRLLTTDGRDSGLGTTARHRAAVLDLLAGAGTHPGGSLVALEQRLRRGGAPARLGAGETAVMVSSDRLGDAELRLAYELSQRTPLTLVLVECGGGRGGRARPGRRGLRVVRVPLGPAKTTLLAGGAAAGDASAGRSTIPPGGFGGRHERESLAEGRRR